MMTATVFMTFRKSSPDRSCRLRGEGRVRRVFQSIELTCRSTVTGPGGNDDEEPDQPGADRTQPPCDRVFSIFMMISSATVASTIPQSSPCPYAAMTASTSTTVATAISATVSMATTASLMASATTTATTTVVSRS